MFLHRYPTSNHRGASFKAVQKARLSAGGLPGAVFFAIGNGDCVTSTGNIPLITIRIMSIRSSVHRCGVVKCVRIMDEAALHNVGGLCFGILHKNLTKFEVLYLVTSMLVPAVTATLMD